MTEGKMGYFSKFVAQKIGISKDTLRTWSIKLESMGVEFQRNPNKQRIYYDRDILAFLNMKELLDLQQPQNDVIKVVADKLEKGVYDGLELENNEEKTPAVSYVQNGVVTEEKRMELFKNELIEEFGKQHQMALDQFRQDFMRELREMTEMMEKRHGEAMENAIKVAVDAERKKIEQEMMETRMLEAASVEKTDEKDEKTEKKSFFKRLFG